jgi:hypothetical protein
LDKIEENQTKYEAVQEYIDEYSDSATSQNLIKYFFRTDLTVSEESQGEYDKEFFAEVKGKFEGENKLVKESEIIAPISRVNKDDAKEIEQSWTDYLLQPKAEEKSEDGLSAGAIWAIVIGSVIVVAAAVAIPTVIVLNKKAAKKREEEATVNAYKRKKIDTTDDKSIDVYADETPVEEAPVEETAAEAEETTEAVEETTAEEIPAEETEKPEEAAEGEEPEKEQKHGKHSGKNGNGFCRGRAAIKRFLLLRFPNGAVYALPKILGSRFKMVFHRFHFIFPFFVFVLGPFC